MSGLLAKFAKQYNLDPGLAEKHKLENTSLYSTYCQNMVQVARTASLPRPTYDDSSSSDDDDEIKASAPVAQLTALVIDYAKEFGLSYATALEEKASLNPRYHEFEIYWRKKEEERLAKKPKLFAVSKAPLPKTKEVLAAEKKEAAAKAKEAKDALAAEKKEAAAKAKEAKDALAALAKETAAKAKAAAAAEKLAAKEAKASKAPSKKKNSSPAVPIFNYLASISTLDPIAIQHMRFALFCKMQEQFPRGIDIDNFLNNSDYDHLNDIIQALYDFAHEKIPLSKEMLSFLQKGVKFYNKPIPISNEDKLSSYMKFGLWARRQNVESNVDSIIRLFRLNKSGDEIEEFVKNPGCVNHDLQSVISERTEPFQFDSSFNSSCNSSCVEEDLEEGHVDDSVSRSWSMQALVGNTPRNPGSYDDMFGEEDAGMSLDNDDADENNDADDDSVDNDSDNMCGDIADDISGGNEVNELLDNAFIQEEADNSEEVLDNSEEVLDNAFILEEADNSEEVSDNNEVFLDNSEEVLDNNEVFLDNNEEVLDEPISLGKRTTDFRGLRVYQQTVAELLTMENGADHLSALNHNVAKLFENHPEQVVPYLDNVESFVQQKRARLLNP